MFFMFGGVTSQSRQRPDFGGLRELKHLGKTPAQVGQPGQQIVFFGGKGGVGWPMVLWLWREDERQGGLPRG